MRPESCSSSAVVGEVVIEDNDSDAQPPDLLSRAQMLNDSPQSSSLESTLDELFSHEATLITECAGESYNTAAILRYCRNRIIKPRDIIFSLVGYRAWSKDGADLCLCMKAFSFLYYVFLLIFLCFGPVLQYDICFRRDKGIVIQPMNHLNTTDNELMDSRICSGSLVFVYVIPSVLFLMAYLVTCLVLRCGEPEHIQTLLERVYLISACSPWELVKQRRLGCVWVTWLGLGLVCLVLSLTSMCIFLFTAPHIPYTFIQPHGEVDKLLICGIAVGSLWLGDIVIVVGVLLYCAQCHLMSTLIGIVRTTLIQGAISLLSAKKQIDESSRFLRHLNQELGMSVGLYLCLIVFRLITSMAQLVKMIRETELSKMSNVNLSKTSINDFETLKKAGMEWLHIVAMITNLVPWLLLMVVPLFMAARLSSGYRALSKVGCQLHARPFGYQATPQTDIDSFLLYVSSLSLKAKILWIPVRTYFLVSVLILSVMSTIILSYLYI